MDDSIKCHHPSDASHQSHHSPDAEPPQPEDEPPVESVAHKPDEHLDDIANDHDGTADLNQKPATVNHQASTDQGNLVSPGSQKQKQTTTSTRVDPIDHTSSSSWGYTFKPQSFTY